jgi:integrase
VDDRAARLAEPLYYRYNTVTCALRFFYRHVLGAVDADVVGMVPFARKERKLPAILSQDEVRALLAAVETYRDRVIVTVAYACGLRVSEVAALKVSDIDGQRMLVHVHSGKGRKERLVPLAASLLELLREYWKLVRPSEWLFEGLKPGTHVDTRTIQRARGSGICATLATTSTALKPSISSRTSTALRSNPTSCKSPSTEERASNASSCGRAQRGNTATASNNQAP